MSVSKENLLRDLKAGIHQVVDWYIDGFLMLITALTGSNTQGARKIA